MNNLINKLSLDTNLKEQIIEFYIKQNLSKKEVQEKLNLTNHTLSKLLEVFEIKKDKDMILAKRRQTCLNKYGVDNPSKNANIKQAISEKNKENSKDIVNKGKATKLERYGNANYCNIEKGKLTKKIRYNNENYNNRSKYKETMLDKYGVENTFQLESFKKSNLDRILNDSNYSDLFKELFNNKDKAIEYLKDKNLSYYDLKPIFNAPYYTLYMWANKLNIKDYIKHTFDGQSHYEEDIINFLNSIGITKIEKHNTEILNGQEIDIYLPENKIGIEFNGTYWHSDLYKKDTYHYRKSLLAQEKGIRLIHIYQYEWDNELQKEKIKSLLRIALGKVNTKIYARQCEIRIISNKEAKELNDQIHLQGHRNAQVTYGLFYEDKLVQLMSFSKNKKYEWEIIRGCPGSNNIVIGGVSRLFSHFIKDYNPKEVFSYCDFNKFNGKSYEALGMKFIGYTGPDMKYIINGEVVNRQPSRYKEIKAKIESRIYGSGSKKYLWTKE